MSIVQVIMQRLDILLLIIWYSLIGHAVSNSIKVWFIWPTIPNGNLNCPSEPCYSLQETIANSSVGEMIFQSNTRVVFLSGVHVLESDTPLSVTIRDAENLALVGDDNSITGLYGLPQPATKVLCKTPVRFAFLSITNLSLVNLTMSGCGANISDTLYVEAFVILTHGVHAIGDEQKAALFLVNISNLCIEHCSIQSSLGFGVLGVNTLGNTSGVDKITLFR